MKKRFLSVFLAAAMTTSLFAGCGSTGNEGNEGNEGAQTDVETTESEATQEATSGDEVTLEILSLKIEEAPQAAFEQIISNFESTHEGVHIEIQSMNSDNLKTTLRSRAASGDMPDIVTWMKEIDEEYLLDLSGEDFLSNINEDALSGANKIYESGTYAMPLDNGYIGLFYNKDVLEENGIELPTTYSELLAACETLEANGVTPFASSLSDLSVPYMALIGLFAENVYAANPDWSAERDAGEHSFVTDEGWKKSFDQLTETVYQYCDPDNAYNLSYDDCAANFANGENAFYFEGSWALSSIRSVNSEANIGIMAFPISDNPDDSVLLCFPDTSLSICKDSDNVDLAKEFLAYMASEEAGQIWSENCAVSSAINGVEVDYDPIAADVNAYISSGKITPLGDRVLRTTFTDKLWEIFSYYMLGESDWETTAATLDEYWDKAYEEQQ